MSEVRPIDAWFVDRRLHSSFPIHRRNQIREDGEAYVWLDDDLSFVVNFSDGTKKKYRIRKGYKFDGASIPKLAQWLIGPPLGGPYEAPACAHDILCESKEMNAWDAGLVFNFLMDSVNVAGWRRTLMWWAVRRVCQLIQDRYSDEVHQFARDHLEVMVA